MEIQKSKRGYPPGTFSIAAYDSATAEVGVAITTGISGVGAVCPYVSDDAAVATQSFTKTSHGAKALDLVERGIELDSACEVLLQSDDYREYRQVHGVSSQETTYTYTGDNCVSWCGSISGKQYTIAGNMLIGKEVLEAVEAAFLKSSGELSHRLIKAIEDGQSVGGDKRGKVSAALLVHSPEPRRYHNLRVDLSDHPVHDLRELYNHSKEVHENLPDRLKEMIGEYPPDMLCHDIKY